MSFRRPSHSTASEDGHGNSFKRSFRAGGTGVRRTLSDVRLHYFARAEADERGQLNSSTAAATTATTATERPVPVPSSQLGQSTASTSEGGSGWATPGWAKQGGKLDSFKKRYFHRKRNSESSGPLNEPAEPFPRPASSLGLYTSQLSSSVRSKVKMPGRRESSMALETVEQSPTKADEPKRPWLSTASRKSSRPSLFDQIPTPSSADASPLETSTPPRTPRSQTRQDSESSVPRRVESPEPMRVPPPRPELPAPRLSLALLGEDDWGGLLSKSEQEEEQAKERHMSINSDGSIGEIRQAERVKVLPPIPVGEQTVGGTGAPTLSDSNGPTLSASSSFGSLIASTSSLPALAPPLTFAKPRPVAFESLPTPPARALGARSSFTGPQSTPRQAIAPSSWSALSLSASEMALAKGRDPSDVPELKQEASETSTDEPSIPSTPPSFAPADDKSRLTFPIPPGRSSFDDTRPDSDAIESLVLSPSEKSEGWATSSSSAK